MRIIMVCITALLVFWTSALAAETAFPVQAGGTEIIIPIPDQYVEVGDEHRFFPDEAPNRLLAWFVKLEDMKKFSSDNKEILNRYMQIQISKGAENRTISASDFSKVAASVSKQQNADYAKSMQEVNRILKKLAMASKDIPEVEISHPKSLGTFLKTDRAVGFLMLMSVSSKEQEKPIPVLCGGTIMRVREKLIFAYVYAEAHDKDAMQWVKSTSRQWAESIIKVNGQR